MLPLVFTFFVWVSNRGCVTQINLGDTQRNQWPNCYYLFRVRPCFFRPWLDGTYNKFSVFERLHNIELAGNCRSRLTLLQPQSSLTQRSRDSGSGEDTPAAKQLPSRLVPALLTWCHNNPSQNTALTLTSIVYLILFFLFLDFHSRAKCILYSL